MSSPRGSSEWVRAVPVAAAFLVAAASFTLSFFAQSQVAATLGAVPNHLSWLVPITIDGGILADSASVWASSARRAKKDPVAYLTIVALLALSVVINVQHAAADGGPLGSVIAGAPPVILLLCLELVAAQARRDALARIPAEQDTPNQVLPAPAAVPSAGRFTPAVTTRPPGTLSLASSSPVPPVTAPVPTPLPVPAPTVASPTITPPAARTSLKPVVLNNSPAMSQPPTSPPSRTPNTPVPVDDNTGPRSQAARIRAEFTTHVTTGGDPADPALSRRIADALNAPLPSVRKVVAQERKALKLNG